MKKELLISVLAAGLLTMSGCGSSDDSSASGDKDKDELATPSQITTKAEAKKAIAATSQMEVPSSDAKKSAQRVAAFVQKASARKSSSSEACQGGGTLEYNKDTTTYKDCVEDGTTTNGTLTSKDDITTGTLSMIDDKGTIDITITFSVSTDMQYISWTGNITHPDDNSTFVINNFKTGQTLGVDGDYETQNCIYDENGTNESCGEWYYVPITEAYDASIDGGFTINLTAPEVSCMNGTYDYKTVKKLHHLAGESSIESGILDINGVNIEFNSDNTAKVTYADGTTDIIEQDAKFSCK